MNRALAPYSLILLADPAPEGEDRGLASLAALPPAQWEGLAVLAGADQARQEALRSRVAELGGPLRVMVLPPCPAGAARNQAAEAARGEVLFFSQTDCRLPPDLLARLDADLADAELTGVGGLCRPTDAQEPWARLMGLELELERGEQLPDALCAAYRRQEFLQAGGFDPADEGEGLENYELAYRLSAAEQDMALDPELAVKRPLPASLGPALTLAYHLGRNRFRNILHRRRLGIRGRGGTRRFWQSVLVLLAVAIPVALAGRDPQRAFTLAAVCLLLLYPLNRGFLKQISSQEPELMSKALLWCLLRPWAWTLGMLRASLDRVTGQGRN
ncbi:MAG: hypothetical protein K9K66_01670 [Desulfarculaceae bacterium]|nr:hypothetical protein [Desulfarculaceae bacterium]MCF8073509.1 hypothetical protein [Desulfarculaceae bacterium]MCF8100344.1 hypothetical protein [Desulfarculaceae bacterium]MCF8117541.1 hypothetical protein [Desulfarculaceae bacterium]